MQHYQLWEEKESRCTPKGELINILLGKAHENALSQERQRGRDGGLHRQGRCDAGRRRDPSLSLGCLLDSCLSDNRKNIVQLSQVVIAQPTHASNQDPLKIMGKSDNTSLGVQGGTAWESEQRGGHIPPFS